MPFSYYKKLSRSAQKVYRRSDEVEAIDLARPELCRPLVVELQGALAADDRERVQSAAARLCRALVEDLEVPPVDVEVLAVRPRFESGTELHGLYTAEPGVRPRIQVWMRTAHHRRVVAWKTMLRTLLHEVCHHLDFHYLMFQDSYHTDGFFKRESSLFHQIVP